jgi:hypothetical protein
MPSSWVGNICRRLFLRMLRWRITLRSHPLRVRIVSYFLLSVILLLIFRHFLWIHVPIWIQAVSRPIFVFSQVHPIFGRILHVLFNAIPDTAFALLAVAGLAYLVPKRFLDKLEDLVWVRLSLIVLFVTFGFSAIIVNAIKSENQEYIDDQHDKTLNLVLGDVTHIQDALSPKSLQMTEAERRRHLLDSLRDQYVIEEKNVDPEIVDGKKMPPDDWLNRRLEERKESWQIHTPPIFHLPSPTTNLKPSISVLNITTQLPATVGGDATANIQISVNGREAVTVKMGQLTSIYPIFLDNGEAQRAIENTLWNQLEKDDKQSALSSLTLPVNIKFLTIPMTQKNISQTNLSNFKAGNFAFYFMVHVEDLKGETLLNSCFSVDNKNHIQFCREHNGP